MEKDCLSCVNSWSTDDDELVCVLKKVMVNDDDVCVEYKGVLHG